MTWLHTLNQNRTQTLIGLAKIKLLIIRSRIII